MSINSIENATRYSEELDRLFTQKSVTGFFADNNLTAKFVGAKTVIIPDVNFQGLSDYDRNNGFAKGAIRVSNTSHTMTMDRARSLHIDREDLDETGIANLAGNILGEYVRTNVVPECDAYVISKLATIAKSRSNTVNGDINAPLEALNELILNVQDKVGFDEELVAFVDSNIYAKLNNSSEISKQLIVSDFKQGDINLKVRSLNGVAIIPVTSSRMKTDFLFQSGEQGGFKPADNSSQVYMLVCPKSGAHLVKKTEKMRIFTPENNVDADAYKFDYRIYYDVFVNKSGLDTIWAWLSTPIMFSNQPITVSDTVGSIDSSFNCMASSPSGAVGYQWYTCEDEYGNGAVRIPDATASSYSLPTDIKAGTYYYFVAAKIDGIEVLRSNIAKAIIIE